MKKVLSILLTVVMILSCVAITANARSKKASDYPFVLVHGMMGYGENSYSENENPYWGMASGYNIPNELRAKGLTVAVPSVGPLSSAWDRACELFAQLTGTVVDYGAAHSAQYGHSRYGRDYTGKAMIGKNWYKNGKINLVSHSFGGPTVRVLSSLLALGCQDEINASPDDCSPLFKGGYNCVYSITTLESPNNGSPIANLMNDLYVPIFLFALNCNIKGTKDEIKTDYMLDQWGLTTDPSCTERAKFNPLGILKIATSGDTCAYDMSLQGAKKLNAKYKMDKNVYYFSVSADMISDSFLSSLMSEEKRIIGIAGIMNYIMAGGIYGGVKTDRSWAHNDGMVPVPSAMYPEGQPHEDYTKGTKIQKGVWYVLPTVDGSHGYGISGQNLDEFWTGIIKMLDSI